MVSASRISATWRDMLSRVPTTPLIAFLLVSLPLTAIAIYYLPYPDLAPGMFVWLVVQSLGVLLLLSQQDSKGVGIERYLTSVLVIASFMVLFPTLYIGGVVFNPSSLPAFRMVIADLVVSFICLATFVLLRRRVSATLHRFLSNRFVLVAQFVIAFAFPLVIIGLLPDKWAEAEEQAKHGPAAPWQVQLSVAQAEAARHDKEAVLEAVTAFQVYAQHPDYMTALYTHFHFITPSGERFSVAFDDIDPQGMVSVEGIDPPNEKQKPTQQQLQYSRAQRPPSRSARGTPCSELSPKCCRLPGNIPIHGLSFTYEVGGSRTALTTSVIYPCSGG